MSYAEYQKHFEELAQKESDQYDAMSVDDILLKIKKKKYGSTYQIWYSLAKRAKIEHVGWVLFEILTSKKEYLIRYHCAVALLELFTPEQGGFKPIHLSGENQPELKGNLKLVEKQLISQIGEKPKKKSFFQKFFGD